MMNPYSRGHSWNPYNCSAANLLPNRVSTLADARYRSFHAQPPIASRSAKSRASLALPAAIANNGNSSTTRFFGSSHQLAHFHDHQHHDLLRPPVHHSCFAAQHHHCCGCCHHIAPPIPYSSHYLAGGSSTYDLNNGHCGTCHQQQRQVSAASRLYASKHHHCRSSQRYIKQDPWEPMHERSKSLRWTKEQLEKFDNLIVPSKSVQDSKSHRWNSKDDNLDNYDSLLTSSSKHMNESSSSSSGDNLTDDSGIQSKSTNKDSPRLITRSIITRNEPVKIERVAIGRRPVRKLPAVPSSKQATIVQLKKPRALPQPPTDETQNNKENESPSKLVKQGIRLSNFFRSVKFPKSKKLSPAPVRIFGRDLSELAKITGCEVPEVLTKCTIFVEEHGLIDGIYRISGISSNIKRLKAMFDTQTVPNLLHKEDWINQDIHCVPSMVKLFFRELPEPLCPEKSYSLLRKGANVASVNSDTREAMPYFKDALACLTPVNYNCLKHLMIHLHKVSGKANETGMTSKNLAIVWAPNLLRTPLHTNQSTNIEQTQVLQHSLIQNTQIVQYMIDNAKWIFAQEKNNSVEQNNANIDQSKLPPQYLERVKFIELEEPKPTPLSKRYTSSEEMSYHQKEANFLIGGISEGHGSTAIVRRLWNNNNNNNTKRPLSMDFSDMYNPDPFHHSHHHHHILVHHPVTHRHIHHNMHVSDV